jgi:hypothetical protein
VGGVDAAAGFSVRASARGSGASSRFCGGAHRHAKTTGGFFARWGFVSVVRFLAGCAQKIRKDLRNSCSPGFPWLWFTQWTFYVKPQASNKFRKAPRFEV